MNIALILILGLIIGSFVAAATYRIPRNIDFVFGRSFCDSCKSELSWQDNIPLFSFFFYGGKSRCCSVPGGRQKKIGVRYPIIEFSTATGFTVLFLTSLPPIAYIIFTISLAIFVIDFEHQIIPDELTWILLLSGLYAASSTPFLNIFSGFVLALLLLVLYLVTSGRGIGLGDVKLAIPFGIILGLQKGLYWIAVSFILGGIVASSLLLLKKATLKTKIAFGPFMIVSYWVILIFWNFLFL